MPHRFVDHTGEVELHVEAASEEAVFAETLAAFAELVGRGGDGEHGRRTIELASPDRPTLLVDWVNELVYLAEVDRFLPGRVDELTLQGNRLRAVVGGRVGAAPANLVKAATYSGLELERREDGWHARLVLDA